MQGWLVHKITLVQQNDIGKLELIDHEMSNRATILLRRTTLQFCNVADVLKRVQEPGCIYDGHARVKRRHGTQQWHVVLAWHCGTSGMSRVQAQLKRLCNLRCKKGK